MPTFDALLRGVLDQPDEDLPRQILGDFLLDQPDAGDQARGEFIHVQCRLARMADDDPARPELELRQAQLSPTFPQRWARPFRRRGAKAWAFGRGLVEGLTLRPAEFDRMADLIVSEQPVRRLRLLGRGWLSRLRDWPGLERVRALSADAEAWQLLLAPHLAGLREVSLPWGVPLDAFQSAAWLNSVESLEVSTLGGTPQAFLSPSRLPRLRRLETTSLGGVGDVLPQLRELKLTHANIPALIGVIQGAKSALESLTLDGCYNYPQTPNLSDLLRLPALSGLRSFELRDLTLSDAEALIDLLGKGRVTRLTLHNAVDKQLKRLADSGRLGNLRELSLARPRSTPLVVPAGHVEALANADLRSLRSLTLSGYGLSMNDVLDLLGAPWLDQLHSLALRSCVLNPHAVSVIVRRAWPGLGLLDLRGNPLGGENQALLRRKLGLRVKYS